MTADLTVNGNGAPPVANRSVVKGELARALRSGNRIEGSSVLLLRAAPEWRDEPTFSVDIEGSDVPVAVAPCPTVLSVLDALAAEREPESYLIVLTPCETEQIGDSILARAMRTEVKPINRWDLVQDAFGARRLDPALTTRDNQWVAEGLLDAQPTGGWRRLTGTVLTMPIALNRLAAARLSMEAVADDSGVDAAALLEWTTDTAAVASFLALREAERTGLEKWIREETAKQVADVVFLMGKAGKLTDAVPFGLVIAALYGREDTNTAWIRAEERYLGGQSPDPKTMKAFGEAAESLVTRWMDNGHAPQAAEMCERAEAILRDLGGSAAAGESKVLEAGLDARFAALAEAITAALPSRQPTLAPDALITAEKALGRIREHGRRRDHEPELAAAEDAVRLLRWLSALEGSPATLAEAATRMLRSWAWADRALATVSRADTSRVPRLERAYSSLLNRVRERRAGLDETFARKLAAWTQGSATTDGLLLVENVLERVARPVAGERLPVIVVLDGMSARVGSELAEEITRGGRWLEVGRREDGREPVLATVPSVTSISRTSLLTGKLSSGAQDAERAGFTAFWGRRKSRLFHKAELTPESAQSLSRAARDAITDTDMVVGIVLNTIDDALDRDKQGGPGRHWTVGDVTYLPEILDEARRASRPIILAADHGHVLDRGQHMNTAKSEWARYRSGTPGQGEITVRGPRVLANGGEVVAAVDEAIHYKTRKAGYHGGASPAEIVVPVITLLPSQSLIPDGWFDYDRTGHAPVWWTAPVRGQRPAESAPAAKGQRGNLSLVANPSRSKKRVSVPEPDGDALFSVSEAGPTSGASLGARVAASPQLAAQRKLVRRAPDDVSVAALIDALDQAGGRLTAAEAATAAGTPQVRMSGYLAQVTRLLNVDGYPVLQIADKNSMVKLNVTLLRQQFLGE